MLANEGISVILFTFKHRCNLVEKIKAQLLLKHKYLIALSASAGGLAALSEFFDNTLPDHVSYVIIMHLYSHQKSLLVELLKRHSVMEVCDVVNNIEIKPNMVYVMQKDKVMTIKDGKLLFSPRNLSIRCHHFTQPYVKTSWKEWQNDVKATAGFSINRTV